ncbi:hypothetical protein K466DRAFT_479395 [Polyporus arcularius HHB13444]|uniref:Uncharacterized protein n=1 Tax=Polyporus arcularius HHB13444 TaxID=1314778 RepID=A0A5C3PTD7_9APHY|nr:hypothetical protein K466DRAFT_479395 [Polyporus arcularius HHB13444]
MSSSGQSSEASRLKTEGNSLFTRNDFTGAYEKYTEALKHDDKNAVLYCNRAACSLGLNRSVASYKTLSSQATQLDPAYTKAWGRLANARAGLNRPDQAVEAWERAVGAFPAENLTAAQQKQKEQYQGELAAAKAKLDDLLAHPREPQGIVRLQDGDQLPWNRAAAMLPELQRTGVWASSAWVADYTYQEWKRALSAMKEGRVMHTSRGAGYFGRQGVVEGLTNAIIADPRVFHISDQDFLTMYNRQMMFEIAQTKAWTENGSRDVMKQVPERLRAEGWDVVRPALSLTVRGWIMRAFLEDNLKNNVVTALDFYTSALEVLQWGQELYKDVPFSEKGQIFQPTFIRGVKSLRLDAFMKAYTKERSANPKYSLDELLAGAQELLDELVGAPTQPQTVDDYAFILAFHRYPTGQAHAIRGFYYNEKARALRGTVQGLSRAVVDLYLEATKAYTEASACYPPDEESYPWYLHCALQAMWESVGQVKCLLALLDSMKKSIVLVKRIWEFGANWTSGPNSTPGFVVHLEKDMMLRDQLLEKMRRGEINRDSLVSLQGDVIIRASNAWA